MLGSAARRANFFGEPPKNHTRTGVLPNVTSEVPFARIPIHSYSQQCPKISIQSPAFILQARMFSFLKLSRSPRTGKNFSTDWA